MKKYDNFLPFKKGLFLSRVRQNEKQLYTEKYDLSRITK